MNKLYILFTILSLTLVACDTNHNNKQNSTQYVEDNTGKNIRDRDVNAVTPFDQSESKADLAITQNIRKMIMDDPSLSFNAKNIKIITDNGVVTLRGPVDNAQEKVVISNIVTKVAGIKSVNNLLEVRHNA